MTEISDLFIEHSLVLDDENSDDIKFTDLSNPVFGILNLKTILLPPTIQNHTIQKINLLFMFDSLSISKNNNTKIQHVINIITNMISSLLEFSSVQVIISVYAFDENVRTIIEPTEISKININDDITNKINLLTAGGVPNFDNAFHFIKNINQTIDHLIFFTDKNQNSPFLLTYIDTNIQHHFIGLDTEGNNDLFHPLNSNDNSNYYIADKLENSPLICQDIVQKIIFSFLSSVEIEIENGFIYDTTKNVWINTIYIGNIAGNQQKRFSIILNYDKECCILLKGKNKDKVFEFYIIEEENCENLMSNIYEQICIENIYIAEKFLKKNKASNYCFIRNTANNEFKTIKNNLYLLYHKMSNYLIENNIPENEYINNIYEIYETFQTIYNNMKNKYYIERNKYYSLKTDSTTVSENYRFPSPPKLIRNNKI
jgi:hypothetical protein